jgi:lipopolysaccharide/colanic/teichoic acid biosynthesis glycosyltransferase
MAERADVGDFNSTVESSEAYEADGSTYSAPPFITGGREGTATATAEIVPLLLNRPVALAASARSVAEPSAYPLKRTVDIIASLVALTFLGPLMIVTALLIWMLDPGPVIYVQDRLGFGGRRFRILKFRTMHVDAEDRLSTLLTSNPVQLSEWTARQKLSSDPRVTRFGRFLRLSSIDELPQLINVLKGDMSLVGPRPIVASERTRYGRYFLDYCRLRPGITGLWQVSGRNNTTYRRRVALDVAYGQRMSLGFDLKIMWKTLPAIVEAEGCY